MKIIKRGGFREQAARQLKYKNSVNQRANISQQKTYQPFSQDHEETQDSTMPSDPVINTALDEASTHSCIENDSIHKSIHKNS